MIAYCGRPPASIFRRSFPLHSIGYVQEDDRRKRLTGGQLLHARCAFTFGPGCPSGPPARPMRRAPRCGDHRSDGLLAFRTIQAV
jgi:hypothetical protein